MAALEIKRFHHSKRNKKGILCEIIMPAAFVCLAMCMTLILPGLEEEPPLEMNPWIYPTKVLTHHTKEQNKLAMISLAALILLIELLQGGGSTLFFANDDKKSNWPQRYTDSLLSQTGFSTKCIDG